EGAGAGQLDALAVHVLLHPERGEELDRDLARLARIVGLDRGEMRERLLGAGLDQLARLLRRLHTRAHRAEALFHLDRRHPVAARQTARSPVTSTTGTPHVPQSAALMPVSPTSVPLKLRLSHA